MFSRSAASESVLPRDAARIFRFWISSDDMKPSSISLSRSSVWKPPKRDLPFLPSVKSYVFNFIKKGGESKMIRAFGNDPYIPGGNLGKYSIAGGGPPRRVRP